MVREKAISQIKTAIRGTVENFDRPRYERSIRNNRNKISRKRIVMTTLRGEERIIDPVSAIWKRQIKSELVANLRNQSVIVMNANDNRRGDNLTAATNTDILAKSVAYSRFDTKRRKFSKTGGRHMKAPLISAALLRG